jgi:hypothetical protein
LDVGCIQRWLGFSAPLDSAPICDRQRRRLLSQL